MKKSRILIYSLSAIIAIGVISVSFYSCEKENILPSESSNNIKTDQVDFDIRDIMPVAGEYCGSLERKTLITKDNVRVGTGLVYNDSEFLYVIMKPTRNYMFKDAFLHICANFEEIPLNVYGSPDLSSYNFQITGRPDSFVRKFKIALSRVPNVDVRQTNFISVAVEVRDRYGETTISKKKLSWLDGKYFDPNKVGRVFTYSTQICPAIPDSPAPIQ